MSSIIVADTGPLIALSVLDLIPTTSSLFEKIYVPQAVIYEATHAIDRPGARGISNALKTGLLIEAKATHSKTLSQLSLLLDQGESEALTLAKHLNTHCTN